MFKRLIALVALLVVSVHVYANQPGVQVPTGMTTNIPGTNISVIGPQDENGILEPSSDDLSLQLISAIFGGNPATAETFLPVIGSAMNILVLACAIIAAWLVLISAGAGVVHTMSDGEFLGRRWSATWIAVRYSVAALMLVPVASGFCNGQLGALWVINMGVGVADNMAAASVKDFSSRMGDLNATMASQNPSIAEGMREILAAEACLVANSRAASSNGADAKDSSFNIQIITDNSNPPPGQDGRALVRWGKVGPNGEVDNSCGSVLLPGAFSNFWEGIGNTGGASLYVGEARVREIHEQIKTQIVPIRTAQLQALSEASATMRQFATNELVPKLVTVGEPGAEQVIIDPDYKRPTHERVNSVITSAAYTYASASGNAVNSIMGANTGLASRVGQVIAEHGSDGGWVMLGAWYFQFAKFHSQISQFVADTAGLKWMIGAASSDYSRDPVNGPLVSDIMAQVGQVIGTTNDKLIDDLLSSGSGRSALDVMITKALQLQGVVGTSIGYDPEDSRHPLLQIQSSGTKMIGIGIGIYSSPMMIKAAVKLAEVGAKGAAGARWGGKIGALVGGVKGFLGSATETFTQLSSTIGVVLILLGLMKTVVIPFWPLLKWLKQIVVFLVTVCEVMVAIPLWVAFHFAPEGDGFSAERTRTGYGILLEAALRPPLLVLGLLFSYLIMWPVLFFANKVFMMTSVSVNSEYIMTTLLVAIGQGVLYAIFTLFLIDWACDVIDGLSGRVMSWINIAPGHNNNDLEQKVMGAFGVFRTELRGVASRLDGAKAGDKMKGAGQDKNKPVGEPGSNGASARK